MRETIQTATADPEGLAALSDRELAVRVRAGEARAFEPVMRRYNRRLFRAARGITGSDADAEEVVQETYVKAYFHLDEFRGEHLGAWLTQIALNEALMRRRGAARLAGEPIDDEDPVHGDAMADDERVSATPEEVASRGQVRRLLEQAIDRLPESYRLTYVLREVEQLSAREVAESLSISTVTVKTRVFRARRLLRKALSREFRQAADEAYPFDGARCDRTVDAVFRRLAGSPADRSESLH